MKKEKATFFIPYINKAFSHSECFSKKRKKGHLNWILYLNYIDIKPNMTPHICWHLRYLQYALYDIECTECPRETVNQGVIFQPNSQDLLSQFMASTWLMSYIISLRNAPSGRKKESFFPCRLMISLSIVLKVIHITRWVCFHNSTGSIMRIYIKCVFTQKPILI